MFDKNTYTRRREELKKTVGNGLVLIFGNNESPYNCPANPYAPFRQDSTFLYYYGQTRDGLVGVIDIDEDKEFLIGDDVDLSDIIWLGPVENMQTMAGNCGVRETLPFNRLADICKEAKEAQRKIHFLPPYRHDIQILISDLLGIHLNKQKGAASLELIKAVVNMRSCKEEEEIRLLDEAAEIGYKMHTKAMRLIRPGITETFVAGQVSGIALSFGLHPSFPTILTQHGEILHGQPFDRILEDGRLVLCDAGAESLDHYCSDHTRTMPVNGKFTQQQLDIYSIVEACHDYVLQVAKPGVSWLDVHMAVCRLMTNRLKELGLMKGDTDAALQAGAHALFLPHGLGHMMGLDVHDMEALGQIHVGYDEEIRPSEQFGTASLRLGRRLQEGFVVTDEPGIYFIPDLIDDWKANGTCKDFLDFEQIQKFRDFGGIRLEDDLLITATGCRFLGEKRIPYHPKDVEEFMEKNREDINQY